MSGGYWDYLQYRFTDVYEDIRNTIENNGKELSEAEMKAHWNYPEWFEKYPEDKFHHKYPSHIIEEFRIGANIIQQAQVYMDRIDRLLSGDDGEETFLERLKEDLNKIGCQDDRLYLGRIVYHKELYYGREPMKIVGIRENEVELEGDYSGGTHNVCQRDWLSINGVLLERNEDKVI